MQISENFILLYCQKDQMQVIIYQGQMYISASETGQRSNLYTSLLCLYNS